MNNKFKQLVSILGEARVSLDEPLSKYSSMRIGGPADVIFRAKTVADLILAINSARSLSIPFFLLGGGTNLLISDSGFRGIVVKNDTGTIKLLGMKGRKGSVPTVFLEAESGVTINRLVRFALDQGFSGLEYFLGQPGTIGGAVYINAHNMNKGLYFGDNIIEAKILGKDGKVKVVNSEYFRFGYDQSIIQKTQEIVLSVVLQLKRGNKDDLWKEATATLHYRQNTQPSGIFSSGCTFRNIKKSDAVRLATPNFTTSAGFLLESAGLKGVKIGEAGFSAHHANFIIHRGSAKAADVLELIHTAKKKVKAKYGIDLKEEIITVGDF